MIQAIRKELHYHRRCMNLSMAFLRRRMLHCNLQMTYRCDFRCRICDFWKEKHDPAEELTLDEIRVIGEKLRRLGTMVISLGGGEPLIREDLYQAIGILGETGHFPILITNGWHVDETVARDIMRAGLQEISVSLDYADPEKHDDQRGRPGAWKRAVRALELLLRHRPDRRQRVHLISVLLDDNLEEIEPLIELSRDLGVTYMINMYSHGRGSKPRRGPNDRVTEHLLSLKRKYSEFVSLTSYIERFDDAIENGGIGDCQAGLLSVNVGSRGEVTRCIDTLGDPAGNILTDDIFDIKRRLTEMQKERPCAQCWTSCRGFAESMFLPPRARQLKEFYISVKRH